MTTKTRWRPDWLSRFAPRIVPSSWRDSVLSDLEDEAHASGRGTPWMAWQILRAAIRLRAASAGDAIFHDVRYAMRSLLRAPAFAAGAVLTLVLGIGVNLAAFAVVDRALFRPLPFADADRLVFVAPHDPDTGRTFYSFDRRLFVEGRTRVAAIGDMASLGFTEVFLLGEPRDVAATLALTAVSYNLLDVLGVRPVAGRGFTRDDALAKRGIGMVTYEAWQARFGGTSDIIGRVIRGSRPIEIVGVLPKGFIAPAMNRGSRFDGIFMLPEVFESVQKPNETVDPAVARLAPGASMAVAQEQYDNLAAQLDAELRQPGETRGPRVRLEAIRPGMFWYAYRYLWLLASAASLVGLLACANLSSLLLARGRSREQQVALRSALGASRARLLAAELVQGLLICAVAGAIATGVVALAMDSLRALAHPTFALLVLDHVDARMIAASIVAVLASCAGASLWPAWRATRAGLVGVIQRGAGAPPSGRHSRSGQLVLGVEAALGVVLVFGAAVTARNLIGLVTTDLGFRTDGLHVVRIVPTGNRRGGDDVAERARYLGVLDAIRQQGDVVSAGGVDIMLAQGPRPMAVAEWAPGFRTGVWQVTDGFLGSIGARIVAGRDITHAEVDASLPVVLVTEAMVRRLWPDDSPVAAVGRELTAVSTPETGRTDQPRRRIVGVVADIRQDPASPPEPMVFVPIGTSGFWQLDLAVRTSTSIGPNAESLRRRLADEFGVTGVNVTPAGGRIESSLREPRSRAIIFGMFGVIGLTLAAIGLFAVASFDVALRRYELGVRSALGASASAIRRLVIADAIRPVALGALAGVVVAYWIAALLQSLVYQVDARDPRTLAIVVAVLLTTAVLAVWLPARRAARIDPAIVLREG